MVGGEQLTYEKFVGYLRSALHYLYDPVHLRRSPLVELFGLAGEFDRAAALQHALTEAIRALKPADDQPPQARAWRIYDTLTFQYIRQLEREAVAMQLGASERQLRREQRLALEALARHLWEAFDLAVPGKAPQGAQETASASRAKPPSESREVLSEELVWLSNRPPEQSVPLGEALRAAVDLAQPLARQWKATLQVTLPESLVTAPVAPVALRSILLTVLSLAIPRAGGGPVSLLASRPGNGKELQLSVSCCAGDRAPGGLTPRENAVLATALELAAFYGARLDLPQLGPGSFAATLALPAPMEIPVLVIDDNADWLDLLQRYAAGSRYQVLGTPDPGAALRLAQKAGPALVVLDVMMAVIDGWQILSDLRQDPATAGLPVVICTALPVEGLALSLGATAFLQKPVTQEQFLRVLDEQVRLAEWPAALHQPLT
jgi:CheY-like chemotaxis protein